MDDPEEIKQEIEHQKAVVRGYRKRLYKLEEQAARFGVDTPPHIQIEIEELQERIHTILREVTRLKQALPQPKENIPPTMSVTRLTQVYDQQSETDSSTVKANIEHTNLAKRIRDELTKRTNWMSWAKQVGSIRDSEYEYFSYYDLLSDDTSEYAWITFIDANLYFLYEKSIIKYEEGFKIQSGLSEYFNSYPLVLTYYVFETTVPNLKNIETIVRNKFIKDFPHSNWIIEDASGKMSNIGFSKAEKYADKIQQITNIVERIVRVLQ
jgi:hypothetical protein